MNIQSFFNWLISDAGAGWVFGILSFLALIISYFRNKVSRKVIIKEIEKNSLLSVSSKIVDRIHISFDDKEIKDVGQIKLEVYNSGKDVILNPKILITLPDESTILYISEDDEADEFHIEKNISKNVLELKIPYINPFREHKHIIRFSILADGYVDKLKIKGMGENWSTQHVTTMTTDQMDKRFKIGTLLLILVAASIVLYGDLFVRPILGIQPTEVSLRSFVAYLPYLLFLIAIYIWMYPIIKKRI